MSPLLSLASVTIAGTLLLGGASAQADLVAKRDSKLASPFLKNGDWVTDFDTARERAKKEGKLIFAYFTRSFAH